MLLYVTDAWLKATDSGQFVGDIFWTQLIKAFDYINHDILLQKLVSGEVLMSG